MNLKLISGHNLPPPVDEVLGVGGWIRVWPDTITPELSSTSIPAPCLRVSTSHPTHLQAKRAVNPYVIVRVSGAKSDCKMVAELPFSVRMHSR